jgi:hypothetical protein
MLTISYAFSKTLFEKHSLGFMDGRERGEKGRKKGGDINKKKE